MPLDARAAYDQHVAALAAGDLDAIVAGYDENAVLVGPTGSGRGHDFIRTVFAEVPTILDDRQPEVTIQVVDEVLVAVWTSHPAAPVPATGVDTFVFRDGLIVVHTNGTHLPDA